MQLVPRFGCVFFAHAGTAQLADEAFLSAGEDGDLPVREFLRGILRNTELGGPLSGHFLVGRLASC